MKFKVNDTVLCTTRSYSREMRGDHPELNKIYTIAGYHGDYPKLKEIEGDSAYWDDENFVLVDSTAKTYDIVNNPKHYTMGKVQVLDFIEDQKLQFHEAQVLKYVVRAKHKGNELQDLRKAKFYLDRLIGNLENANKD